MATTESTPRVDGKVFIVTGGSVGVGYETAKALAQLGGHVIIGTRNKEKGEKAVETIKKETGNDKVENLQLDLADLSSVRSFANEFLKKNIPLHVLINNAGIYMPPFSLTVDGFENQFASNYIGHFLLTILLLDLLKKSAPSRIINLTSFAHFWAKPLDFLEIVENKNYELREAYARSKLANILFTYELSKRLKAAGIKNVYVNAIHPGVVKTGIADHLDTPFDFDAVAKEINVDVLTPAEGARCSVFVATDSSIERDNVNGKYFDSISCKTTETSKQSYDEFLQKKLWELSEEWTKVKSNI